MTRVPLAELQHRFQVRDVPRDGNCLFGAVAAALAHLRGGQLIDNNKVERLSTLLRRRSTRLLCRTEGTLANTGKSGRRILREHLGPRRSIPAYCRRLATTREWGDEPSIVALSHLVRRCVVIFDHHSGDHVLKLQYGEASRKCVHLLRIHGNHFCALLPKSSLLEPSARSAAEDGVPERGRAAGRRKSPATG